MSDITDKVKEKLKDAKDKVTSTTKEGAAATKETMTSAKDKVTSTTKEGIGDVSSSSEQDRRFEEGAAGTTFERAKVPTKEYDEKEPMSPAKIKQHEPTAVRRDPSDQKIIEPGQERASAEDAKEKARRSGMTKGTAGAADTGSEYEQGAAGSNK
jgi:hypothetical protein